MRKKILFVAEAMQTNGAMMSLIGLLNALSPNDYDISLFCFDHSGELMSQVPQYVKLLAEIPSYRVFIQYKKRAIKWSIRHWRFDLALFRVGLWLERGFRLRPRLWRLLPRIDGAWDAVVGYADGLLSEIVIGRIGGRKRILWVHENYEDTNPTANIRAAFEKADRIACVSHDAVKHFEQWLGRSATGKVNVVHNVTDAERCFKLAGEGTPAANDEIPTIVSVGRLSPEKGYDLVPKITRILKTRGINFRWQIIGNGLPEIAEQLREAVGIEELGRQANPYPYIRGAKMLVSLSRAEGWGMNISEALALHKPVVCSDLAVYREQVTDCVNGFCVARTPEAFADAIEKLLNDDILYAKMCAAAGCEACSPKAVRREFAALVESLEDGK